MIKTDPEVFKRGKKTIWAAAIVWATGSINFLGDKASEPYTTLSDVCDYFQVKASTAGQKASKIRDVLDMDYFSEEYLFDDSPITNIFKNLVMTKDGFIVPVDSLADEDGDEHVVEYVDEKDEELPDQYIAIIESGAQIKHADLYQLEYLFKTILAEDEKFNKIEMASPGNIHLHFYGRPGKVLLFEKKLNSRKYIVSGIVNDIQE